MKEQQYSLKEDPKSKFKTLTLLIYKAYTTVEHFTSSISKTSSSKTQHSLIIKAQMEEQISIYKTQLEYLISKIANLVNSTTHLL